MYRWLRPCTELARLVTPIGAAAARNTNTSVEALAISFPSSFLICDSAETNIWFVMLQLAHLVTRQTQKAEGQVVARERFQTWTPLFVLPPSAPARPSPRVIWQIGQR
jgi:hypothetical protein